MTDTEMMDFLEVAMKAHGYSCVCFEPDVAYVEGCEADEDPSATAIVRTTLRECLIEAMRRERG